MQCFVETIYLNASKFYNGALPAIDDGNYFVIIQHENNPELELKKTHYLQSISKDNIISFSYQKTILSDAMYGAFSQKFRIVTIIIK